ncbi:hypothetical protein SBA2_10135 [Acidobacteriia bacterium SbA2]|nr:hypothetical protein SBA2_10135 [Acidobacteriia bacterium SbA2]
MENSQEESKLSPQDSASPHIIPGETGCGEEGKSEEREARTGLEDDRQEIQGGGEETRAVLLPVNPHLVHIYWEISARDLEGIGEVFSRLGPRVQPVLRFYATAQAELDSANSARRFEVVIALGAGKWYVRLENPANSYCIDLGLRLPGGAFHRLARSNVAKMPKACPSDRLEERYLVVEADHPPAEVAVAPEDRIAESRTVPAYAEPQSREVTWPERVDASAPVPAYAEDPGEEGDVAADQRVSPGRPLYDEWQGEGGIDLELEGARLSRASLAEDVERQLTEFYEQRRREWVWWAPGVKGKEESQTATHQCADLTELSERSFRAGMSSGQKLP